MVHKPIYRPKAVKIPVARVAMDNHFLASGGCNNYWYVVLINAAILMIGRTPPQLNTLQVGHDPSARVVFNIPHPSHTSASVLSCFRNIEHQWNSKSYISSKSGVDIRIFARVTASSPLVTQYGGGPMAESYVQAHQKATSHVSSQSTSNIPKVGAEDSFAQNFEPSKGSGVVNNQIQQATNEND